MQASASIRRPTLSVATTLVLLGLLAMFVLGGVGGYALRALSVHAGSAQQAPATAACPTGSHPVVYYTAGTWGCVAN